MKYRSAPGRGKALFFNYSGRLERVNRGKYKYRLTWEAGCGDRSHGVTEWETLAGVTRRLPEFSFDELECEPDLMFELYTADPVLEFEEFSDAAS